MENNLKVQNMAIRNIYTNMAVSWVAQYSYSSEESNKLWGRVQYPDEFPTLSRNGYAPELSLEFTLSIFYEYISHGDK